MRNEDKPMHNFTDGLMETRFRIELSVDETGYYQFKLMARGRRKPVLAGASHNLGMIWRSIEEQINAIREKGESK
jgi:hypothetical protein